MGIFRGGWWKHPPLEMGLIFKGGWWQHLPLEMVFPEAGYLLQYPRSFIGAGYL